MLFLLANFASAQPLQELPSGSNSDCLQALGQVRGIQDTLDSIDAAYTNVCHDPSSNELNMDPACTSLLRMYAALTAELQRAEDRADRECAGTGPILDRLPR